MHPHPNNKGSNKDLNLKNKNLKNSTADSPAANTACSVPPPKRNGHKIPYDQLPDDFSSLLDIARTLPEKYPPYKKTPRARKLTYHPNWYTVCQKGLDILRGARDTGTGYSISLRYLKEAFESGYTPEQWLLCAQRLFELQADGEEWLANIRASTVNKALPDFIAGRLGSARAPTNVYVAPQGERVVDKLRAMGRLE